MSLSLSYFRDRDVVLAVCAATVNPVPAAVQKKLGELCIFAVTGRLSELEQADFNLPSGKGEDYAKPLTTEMKKLLKIFKI